MSMMDIWVGNTNLMNGALDKTVWSGRDIKQVVQTTILQVQDMKYVIVKLNNSFIKTIENHNMLIWIYALDYIFWHLR